MWENWWGVPTICMGHPHSIWLCGSICNDFHGCGKIVEMCPQSAWAIDTVYDCVDSPIFPSVISKPTVSPPIPNHFIRGLAFHAVAVTAAYVSPGCSLRQTTQSPVNGGSPGFLEEFIGSRLLDLNGNIGSGYSSMVSACGNKMIYSYSSTTRI
jgi:hypothetical protein